MRLSFLLNNLTENELVPYCKEAQIESQYLLNHVLIAQSRAQIWQKIVLSTKPLMMP